MVRLNEGGYLCARFFRADFSAVAFFDAAFLGASSGVAFLAAAFSAVAFLRAVFLAAASSGVPSVEVPSPA